MNTLTEIETRELVDERLRRARATRPAYATHPRHRFLGLRPRVTGPLD